MSLEPESVIFLLGAGASRDADIPTAMEMDNKVEEHLSNDWADLKDLYYLIKSSIVYQRGLKGGFDASVGIEEILGVIEELGKKDRNILYPFIGAWNTHLIQVAGDKFQRVDDLNQKIREKLTSWVKQDNRKGSYLQGLGNFKREYGPALRAFTLNYDLLLESNLKDAGFNVELGFDPDTAIWDALRFEQHENTVADFYVYKLHGSIDWERESEAEEYLIKRDYVVDDPDLIFGVNSKLNSNDPYLFNVHELRNYTLYPSLKLIFTVGYSFSDDYINKLLSQALRRDKNKRIVNVSPDSEKMVEEVAQKLAVNTDSVIPMKATAKEFFTEKLTEEYCVSCIPSDPDIPF
ncbi:MAG: hypothetical protein CMK83_24080 [Pseudomonadales bacterium]|nr:hypothetical protein [Pseudomonadales bacterium]MBI27136.1 hypothetical protein [Pseudomonadales bacterium]HAG96802.1 hypothetical protein [Gammaproteobacteria bacterium]